jgi:orotidine-5'-phosphate decarboxylase
MVGLDPRLENLPDALRDGIDVRDHGAVARAYQTFCTEIISAIAPLVALVKPQAAFFEQLGPPGMQALYEVIAAARAAGLMVILDGKRNDIGTTATAYAQAYLGVPPHSAWGADGLTVSPYLGDDSLAPFVEVAQSNGAGIFVLVKTSNPGGGLFQDLMADGQRLFEHVADYVERLASQTAGNCGLGLVNAVVGATYPEQLAELRQRMPHAWLLVPGFGAQGGAARDVAAAFQPQGLGAIINNSRGIIFAYERAPYRERFGTGRWQEAIVAATQDMIDQLRTETLAGRLVQP